MKHLISVSGGKDSQAVLNYCLKKYPKDKIIPYFCDTGWEADETYEHLEYLEKTLNIKITRLKSDKYDGFEDMCTKKKAFPSRLRRFCTEELKIIPSAKFIKSFLDRGIKIRNYVGVRADESKSKKLKEPKIINNVVWWVVPKRSAEAKYKTSFLGILPKPYKRKDGSIGCPKKAKEFYSGKNAVTTVQPIVYWNEKDVYLYNIKSGTRNNPLYAKGCTRVGCYPCINANIKEIGLLPKEAVNRINALEKKVQATTTKTRPVFFHKGGKLKDFRDIHKKYEQNTLGFDLGCINHLGICE